MERDIYEQDGEWKYDLDPHATVTAPTLHELEESLDILESWRRLNGIPVPERERWIQTNP